MLGHVMKEYRTIHHTIIRIKIIITMIEISTEKPPEEYVNFQSHIERVNFNRPIFDKLTNKNPSTDEEFDNCEEAANEITAQILGLYDPFYRRITPKYWDESEFEGLTPLQIEITILREQRRVSYG